MPTISNELPEMGDSKLFSDFTIELHEDWWRQIEFLPAKILPEIQEEMISVESILFPENESVGLQGYKSIHVRDKIGSRHLSVLFDDFCKYLNILEKGAIRFAGHTGFVKNGFAIRSGNYTYYGVSEAGIIKELCLAEFSSADEEFMDIADRYDLLLVGWCEGQITTA